MPLPAMTVSYRYCIVVAIGFVASAVAYPILPRPYQFLLAMTLPTTAALLYALLRVVWARDAVRDGDDTFEPTYDAIVFAVGVFIIAIHLMVLAALTGALPQARASLTRGTIVILGLLIARIGNLLPRTRPNLAFGIRTPRTLADRHLWMQMHRMAGYVAVGLGAVFVISGAFLPKPSMESVLGTATLIAPAVLVLSYVKYAWASASSAA
jgi:hypothetical protein